jgi:haloalkane dehalogenase
VLLSNTTLPTGERGPPPEFLEYRRRLRNGAWRSAADLIASFHRRPLDADVRDAYDAPFPEPEFQAGLRAFPELLPTTLEDPASQPNRDAWQRLARFERPLLTLYGAADPFTAGAERPFIRRVPGARGQAHRVLPHAGHFLHEDAGSDFAEAAVAFLAQEQ